MRTGMMENINSEVFAELLLPGTNGKINKNAASKPTKTYSIHKRHFADNKMESFPFSHAANRFIISGLCRERRQPWNRSARVWQKPTQHHRRDKKNFNLETMRWPHFLCVFTLHSWREICGEMRSIDADESKSKLCCYEQQKKQRREKKEKH